MKTITQLQEFIDAKPDGVWGIKSQAALDTILHPKTEATLTAGDVGPRNEAAIATLHRKVQPLARQVVINAAMQGITLKITSGTRTYAEQDELYKQGRTKPGNRVTDVSGGHSNHNFGLAFDVTIDTEPDEKLQPVWESSKYRIVGDIGKKLGLFWGGDWTQPNDQPHFELRPYWAEGMSESAMLAELRRRHDNGTDAFA